MAPHCNQPDSFSIGSIGLFCHALMHVQHAKYDLEQPRLRWQHGLHRSTCKQPSFGQGKSKVSTSTSHMFFIGQDTSSKQPSAIAQFSQHHINSRALIIFFTRRILMQGVQHSTQKHHSRNKQIHNIYNMNTTRDKIQKHAHRESK